MVKAVGPFPRLWWCGESLGGVTKAVGLGQVFRGMAKDVGARLSRLGRYNAVEERPRSCGRCQGLGGVAKVVRAYHNPNPNPNPNHKTVGA